MKKYVDYCQDSNQEKESIFTEYPEKNIIVYGNINS